MCDKSLHLLGSSSVWYPYLTRMLKSILLELAYKEHIRRLVKISGPKWCGGYGREDVWVFEKPHTLRTKLFHRLLLHDGACRAATKWRTALLLVTPNVMCNGSLTLTPYHFEGYFTQLKNKDGSIKTIAWLKLNSEGDGHMMQHITLINHVSPSHCWKLAVSFSGSW